MPKSSFYKCPKCGAPLEIEAEYDVDEDLEMEGICVSVSCPECGDTRCDDADDYDIEQLIAKIGT